MKYFQKLGFNIKKNQVKAKFLNAYQQSCLDIVITSIGHQIFDCLPGFRAFLNLVEYNKRLTFEELYITGFPEFPEIYYA